MMAAIGIALGLLSAVLLVALGDLLSEEIRGWLDLVPRGILRLAAAQLDPAQRETIYDAEWLPELCYALRGAESRPITRLILGTRYALGLVVAARRVSRRVGSGRVVQRALSGVPLSTGPMVYQIRYIIKSGDDADAVIRDPFSKRVVSVGR